MSLLEEAKKAEATRYSRKEYSSEDVELAVAWVKGDVVSKQIQTAKKFKTSTQVMNYIASSLRVGVQANLVEIDFKGHE